MSSGWLAAALDALRGFGRLLHLQDGACWSATPSLNYISHRGGAGCQPYNAALLKWLAPPSKLQGDCLPDGMLIALAAGSQLQLPVWSMGSIAFVAGIYLWSWITAALFEVPGSLVAEGTLGPCGAEC
jgi:hypothetical protein